MEIGSTFSSGLQGYQRASNQISEETANINRQTLAQEQQPQQAEAQPTQPQQQALAASNGNGNSVESSIVNLNAELNNAQANVRSVETADQVLGSIIDIRV